MPKGCKECYEDGKKHKAGMRDKMMKTVMPNPLRKGKKPAPEKGKK